MWIFRDIAEIKKANPGLLEQFPIFDHNILKPYSFAMEETKGGADKFYTLLQVRRDPGTFVVALGGFLLVAGLIVVFYSSHRRVWIKIEKKAKGSKVSFAARSNRDPIGLKKELTNLMEHLKH